MRRWDDVVIPAFYRSLGSPVGRVDELRAALSRELAFLSTVAQRMEDDVDNLPALHVDALGPDGPAAGTGPSPSRPYGERSRIARRP